MTHQRVRGKVGRGEHKKEKGPQSAQPKIDLAFVQLQTKYLQADGYAAIQVIPKADFGVDKHGVTLMTDKEAEAFFPSNRSAPVLLPFLLCVTLILLHLT